MYLPSFAIPAFPWNDGATVFGMLALVGLASAVFLVVLALRHRPPIELPSGHVRLAHPMKQRSAI